MIVLLAAALLVTPPADTAEVDPVVVELPKPDTVFCVRYFRQAAWRAPKMTCKTWIEWRAIKGARHDTRTATGKKLMDRDLLMDTSLLEEATAASVHYKPKPGGR